MAIIRLRKCLLLLHLLLLQEMMAIQGEAALCESLSRLFRGACFSHRNCAAICEKEGFLNGRCKFFKCKCSKDCNGGGGGGGSGGGGDGGSGGGPPDEGPPNEGPPDSGGNPPDGGYEPPTSGPSVEGPPSSPAPPSAGPLKKD